MNNMTKKQFAEIICKTFNLKGITSNSFVYVINCTLMGIVTVKVPGRNAYKIYFTIFPLWKATLKECLEIPLFQQAIVDTKNLDIYLPENMTEEDISFILHQCVLQIPFIPAKDITSLDIIKFLYNKIIEDPGISGNFVLEMKVYTLIYNIALICNDYKSAENVYEQISQNINKWDDAIFRYWFGDKKNYLERLQEYDSNRINLQINIQNNLLNPKISKLPKYEFLDQFVFYTLAMGYDNMHRITSKSQHLTQDNVQFNGTLNVGYDLTYTYGTEAGKKFQLSSVKDVNYRTEETPGDNKIENNHVYLYDKNGNLIYVNTGRMMKDGHNETGTGERKLIWDEENRLLAVDDNGFVSNYWYDANGEQPPCKRQDLVRLRPIWQRSHPIDGEHGGGIQISITFFRLKYYKLNLFCK